MSNSKHVDVAGVVLRDDQKRYLLVQERQPRAYGLWGIPAGWTDEGETPRDAAIREAREEVGFGVEIIGEEPIHTEHDATRDYTFYGFLAKIMSGSLSIQKEELLDAKWLGFDEIEKLNADGKIRSNWIIEAIRKTEKDANSRD